MVHFRNKVQHCVVVFRKVVRSLLLSVLYYIHHLVALVREHIDSDILQVVYKVVQVKSWLLYRRLFRVVHLFGRVRWVIVRRRFRSRYKLPTWLHLLPLGVLDVCRTWWFRIKILRVWLQRVHRIKFGLTVATRHPTRRGILHLLLSRDGGSL